MKRAEAARRPSDITVGDSSRARARARAEERERLAVGRAVGAEDSQLKACVRVRAKQPRLEWTRES